MQIKPNLRRCLNRSIWVYSVKWILTLVRLGRRALIWSNNWFTGKLKLNTCLIKITHSKTLLFLNSWHLISSIRAIIIKPFLHYRPIYKKICKMVKHGEYWDVSCNKTIKTKCQSLASLIVSNTVRLILIAFSVWVSHAQMFWMKSRLWITSRDGLCSIPSTKWKELTILFQIRWPICIPIKSKKSKISMSNSSECSTMPPKLTLTIPSFWYFKWHIVWIGHSLFH